MRMRITLEGAGGRAATLALPGRCRDGIALTSLPDGLAGWANGHQWDTGWQQAGGVWRGMQRDIESLRMDLRCKGRRVRDDVDDLLDLLGDGSTPVVLTVTTPWHGDRMVDARLDQVSSLKTYGPVDRPVMVELSVVLSVGRPLWRSHRQEVTVTEAGPVVMMVDGDQPVWPTITITGTYRRVGIRLTEGEEWQYLPRQEDGWRIVTSPPRRAVTTTTGEWVPGTVVPFWPHPVPVVDGMARAEVSVEGAGKDFAARFEWTPESRRAW